MLRIRLAFTHALENHRPIFSDAFRSPDRFMLDRLVRRIFPSVDTFPQSWTVAAKVVPVFVEFEVATPLIEACRMEVFG